MSDLFNWVKTSIDEIASDKILVHSDLIRTIRLQLEPNQQLLDAHCKLLLSFDKDIYMPVFNYDFPKTREFNVKETISKVGVINEHFRINYADWQTPVPVFSFAGTGNFPDINYKNEIDPFGRNSTFDFLYRENASIVYYGADFNASTIIHYVERISDQLVYRYDKFFQGTVLNNSEINDVILKLHVRPMNTNLEYDWIRLENDLIQEDKIQSFTERASKIKIVRVRELVDFWLEKLNEDPLYLLNDECKLWVEPKLNQLGRPFVITDFES